MTYIFIGAIVIVGVRLAHLEWIYKPMLDQFVERALTERITDLNGVMVRVVKLSRGRINPSSKDVFHAVNRVNAKVK